ncbi:hypothetical protein CHU92_01875 [Flavobacterium cyanobacteriorum]|uniref:Copper-binding protein MbnP-like domain-containing protein n=1 Tax=Flavobacterium cyanobacteriorum TaxID=2022802 RepID=A0A255ZW11_9FLAO|nr:MbnP family protein [Flavobacterium cyanobacteriorum]OYQ45601.1 hypothetical protein CHU92_01875 [Flavobacterium cyanobacteriorum]
MKWFVFICLVLFFAKAHTQNFLFVPKFNHQSVALDTPYTLQKDTLTISALKFYITNLHYLNKGKVVYTSGKKAHLVDFADSKTLAITEKGVFDFDAVEFNIGVDSLTSVSGVFEGDLDPANGMYWAWQSGYINFKLEGYATNSPGRLNKFIWHIGGYREPFSALRRIMIRCKRQNELVVNIQLEKLFREIDVSKDFNVMSPGSRSIKIADVLPAIFSISQ